MNIMYFTEEHQLIQKQVTKIFLKKEVSSSTIENRESKQGP